MKDIKVVLERALDVIGLYAPNHEILEQISDILASEQEPIYIVGTGWQACDELNKARIAELEELLAIERDYHFHAIADIKSFRQECIRLELENKTLRDLLREARDDVADKVGEYAGLLPYKPHRYEAQKATLDEIDNALATPTSTEQLKDKP